MDVLAHGQAGTSRLLAADCFPRSNPQAHRAVEGGYSGRDRSTFELISMRPSSRKRLNPVHRESAYRIASASVLFWLTSASFSRVQRPSRLPGATRTAAAA